VRQRSILSRLAALLLAPAALTACSDNTTAPAVAEHVVVVLNSVGVSLTLVPLGNDNIRTIGLGADGTPTTLAVRGRMAVVPMGITNVAAVVDLGTREVRTVALPAGSGATGVAFVNDSIAVVANPGRNSVTPVNVLRATAGAEIAVGDYPQSVTSDGTRVFVMNGTLDAGFQPDGPGSVTVLSAATLSVIGTAQLTGLNPQAGAVRGNRLFVVNAGSFGGGNSSLSVVDVTTRQEIRRIDQMGNFPGSITTLPGQFVFVGAWDTGLLVYNPDANLMVRGLDDPFVPADQLPVSAVRMDDTGLLYTLHPGDCTAPGVLVQLASSGALLAQANVGVCPFAIGFGSLPVS
jgi:hypothetical protein